MLKEARRAYIDASSVCVLTGAGVSAESGIPTFRGEGGLWNNYRAEDLATPDAFERDPQLVWNWYQWRRGIIRGCAPNDGHFAIREIEETKEIFLLITQNVDGLHRRSGSRKIVEMHGNIWDVKCTSCEEILSREEDFLSLPPKCEGCGGLLRPNVVWFGESIPRKVLDSSLSALNFCDLLIVAGTSGRVQPAASFAEIASRNGARVIEVNIDREAGGKYVDYFLMGKSGELLPRLIGNHER
jgi:NAD-dependent deacetylase